MGREGETAQSRWEHGTVLVLYEIIIIIAHRRPRCFHGAPRPTSTFHFQVHDLLFSVQYGLVRREGRKEGSSRESGGYFEWPACKWRSLILVALHFAFLKYRVDWPRSWRLNPFWSSQAPRCTQHRTDNSDSGPARPLSSRLFLSFSSPPLPFRWLTLHSSSTSSSPPIPFPFPLRG
jgi:hypothetical protein